MAEKPLGIFVPKKIQKIIYPFEKIQYEKPYLLATLSRRISVVISYYVLNKMHIKPNSVSIFSIFISFLCFYFFINSNYLLGSVIACLWVVLDNIDGELARLQNSISALGSTLERINSDIFYIFLFSSLSLGLFRENLIDFNLMIITVFTLALFNILRPFLSNFPYPKMLNKNSTFMVIIACQFKNSLNWRKKSRIGSFIFYSWRNVFTQCGINEILLLTFSVISIYSYNYLPEILFLFTLGYLIINLSILLALVFHNFFKK